MQYSFSFFLVFSFTFDEDDNWSDLKLSTAYGVFDLIFFI